MSYPSMFPGIVPSKLTGFAANLSSRLGANSLLIQRTMVSSSKVLWGCCAVIKLAHLLQFCVVRLLKAAIVSWEPWDSQSCPSWHRGEKAQYSSNHDGMSTLNNMNVAGADQGINRVCVSIPRRKKGEHTVGDVRAA